MSISHTIFISIHAPAEGATAKAQNIAYCNNIFQSTLPRRERLATITTKDRFGLVFQSTLPRRERRVASPMPRHSSFQFQSTLPRRERPRTWKAVLLEVIFQSTLPRRERRYRCLNCCKSCCISIHAPAEGATQFMKQTGGDIGISIHAPAEGATQEGGETPPEDSDFNPRSRGGSDSKHTQFFRSNFRTKCAYLYFLLHYIFFTQNKQSYK